MSDKTRLIDANKMCRELQEEFHGMISDEELKIYQILRRLDEQPTVDAVEVVHGRWVSSMEQPRLIYECSVCKDRWLYGAMLNMNYCPSCGAKMDGDLK